MGTFDMRKFVNGIIAEHESRDPFKIAKERDILILFEDLGTINGYYNKCFNQQFIHINTNLEADKQRFVCAHELAHALLHEDDNTLFLQTNTLFDVDELEREANWFASELLIPDDIFEIYPDKSFTEILKILDIYPTS